MHEIAIPGHIKERVFARYGREHVHAGLVPSSTALIVVDMQNGFVSEQLAVAYIREALSIIPNINLLAASVRDVGGRVYWLRHTDTAQSARSWSNFYAMRTAPSSGSAKGLLSEGDIGHEIHPDLDVRDHDGQVLKERFSPFCAGSSDLHERLVEDEIDTLLITGTVTNVCCESTARDAMMLNYKVVMISDANAARTDNEHNATLVSIYNAFGDVMTTVEAISFLRANSIRAAGE